MNYKTVAAYNLQDEIGRIFSSHMDGPFNRALKMNHCTGMAYGYSQFITNLSFLVLFAAGALLMKWFPSIQGENVMLCIFAIFFGAFSAAQAQQFGPDVKKAKEAAIKIFKIKDTPTECNAIDMDRSGLPITNQFEGAIEFENVWFRYPSRRDQWVFKGLNLKINPKETIAIVGESGQGKSTLVNLILRFYDVNAGKVTIDGVDIRSYNVC